MMDDEQSRMLGDWLKSYLKDYNELWKKIRFKQRLKKIVVPSLEKHGFEAFTKNVTGGMYRDYEFSRVCDEIGDIIYIDCLRNIVDRYSRPGIMGVGVIGVFRVNFRVFDFKSRRDLVSNWEFLRFVPPQNVLPWAGEWPFKDAGTLDQLLGIFVQEYEKRGERVFELVHRGASREELSLFAGEALPLMSEEEWDKSPWGKGDIVAPDLSRI